MASGVVNIGIYATLFRGDLLADGIVEMLAPPSVKYGATKYTVQRSRDDLYKLQLQIWFNSKDDWYRYWEGEEAVEFRARYIGKYQVPITYIWFDEIGSDADVPKKAAVSSDAETAAA